MTSEYQVSISDLPVQQAVVRRNRKIPVKTPDRDLSGLTNGRRNESVPFHLKLQSIGNQRNKLRIGGFSFGGIDGIAEIAV